MKEFDDILIGLLVLFLTVGGFAAYRIDLVPAIWFPHYWTAAAFIALYGVWVLSELFNFLYGRNNSSRTERREVCFSLLMTSETILIFALVFANMLSYDFKEDYYGVTVGIMQYFGLTLMVSGILFRQMSIFHLGKNFSTDVTPNRECSLTSTGPYKFIRNPSYTGSILTIISIPLALGTWLAAAIVTPTIIIAYLYRIRDEERLLLEKYGSDYFEYRKYTWKLFPGL